MEVSEAVISMKFCDIYKRLCIRQYLSRGRLKYETVKYGHENKGTLDPRSTAPARASRMYKRQTRHLVREGAPQEQNRNCQQVINIWS
jgi:hypothetical protein